MKEWGRWNVIKGGIALQQIFVFKIIHPNKPTYEVFFVVNVLQIRWSFGKSPSNFSVELVTISNISFLQLRFMGKTYCILY